MSFPFHTTVRTEGRLTCDCGQRLVAEAVHVLDGEFLIICTHCHADLLRVEYEGDADE